MLQSSPPSALRPVHGANRRFASGRVILALILREMSTRYGRSPGGYVWAVIEPLGAIIVLSIGFSLLLRNPSLGTSFLLFYATGYLPFSLYQSITNVITRAITFSKPLLKYPAVTWVDAVAARFLLNLLTGILVAIILITGILSVVDTRTVLEIPAIVLAMGLAAFLGLAIGVLNCALFGLFEVWDIVWSIITRPLFLASGILFTYEDMPEVAQDILWYNPLLHTAGLMRTGFYPMYAPQYISVPFVLTSALVVLALGLVLLGRFHRDILNR